MFVGSK